MGSWGSSVSTCLATDWTTGIRSPAEAKDFSSSLCVQTSSEAYPASYPMGTGGPFPGIKRGVGVTLTTHPHLVPGSIMSSSSTTLPFGACTAVAGQLYFYFYTKQDWYDN
jgi:hypothetical protein